MIESLKSWFAMDGYALYVWIAYGLACSFIILGFLSVIKKQKKTRRQLNSWYKKQT